MISQIEQDDIEVKRPHVVIIGAGATIAAIPNGDKYGHKSSVMNGFIEELGLEGILSSVKLNTISRNIEDIYTELFERGVECKEVREELESAIYEFFSALTLPDEVNLYDMLLLSLTEKDCIASFNWDPFLIQAYNRARNITDNLPQMCFLHGNVAAGYCLECEGFGALKRKTCECGNPYTRTPLLFPVKKKDYTSNSFIRNQWELFKNVLSKAKMLTIFGYSAPKTDIGAIEILTNVFESNIVSHRFDHIEIIERPGFPYEQISDAWRTIVSDTQCQLNVIDSFYDSYLAQSPRRSVECHYKRNIGGWWEDPSISFIENMTFEEVEDLLRPLLTEESEKDRLSVH